MKFTKITNSSKQGTLKPYFEGWLKERYGDCFAQLSIMSTLRLKNSVKDTARFTYGNVPYEIEDLCKRFEMPPQGISDIKFIMGWSDDEGTHQGSIDRDVALQTYISKYPEQWKIAKEALALPRQRGRHASAFVIASKPISDFIPITSVSGVKVTSFTGPEVEGVGGVKMDLLVVSALLDIQECLKLVSKKIIGHDYPTDKTINGRKVPAHRLIHNPVTDEPVDVWDLPLDNNVFRDVSKGKTETVFQFSAHSAIQWLKAFDYDRLDGTPVINSIEAMAAFTALDRPGPLNYMVFNPDNPSQKHNLLIEYARRARGLPGSKDVLPIFEELLPETYGLIVFQEGLQKVYQNLTGCTGSEAEAFRRLSAKKKPEEMAKLHTSFIERATEKIGQEKAQQVWTGLLEFSNYSFCMAHSVGYVTISYACAWLKHYYPLEWWCAVLRNANKDEINEKFWNYVKDIVDLPDIKLSKPTWAIVDGRLRAPIDLCFGIGESAHKQLNKYAPYESADDFCQKIVEYRKANANEEGDWGRSAINIGTIHTLLVAGILDSLFDPNTSIAERLDEYQKLLKKHTLAAGKKYIKSKTSYPTLDALGRYQIRKGILPAYSEDIRKHIMGQLNENIVEQKGLLYYKYKDWSREAGEEVENITSIVGLDELKDMDTSLEMPQCGWKCAIVGYVEDQNTFTYKDKYKNNKTANKLLIDACGFKREMVLWPSQSKEPNKDTDKIKTGSIIVAAISKTDLSRGFSIRKMELLKGPVESKKDE